MDATEKRWTKAAADILIGRKIVGVSWMNKAEASGLGWASRPIIIELDDGTFIYPSADDEGNNGGALFTSRKSEPVLPVMWSR